MEISKEHFIENQEERRANKIKKHLKRNINGGNLDVLANLKQVLKSLKRRQKQNKRRGGQKRDSLRATTEAEDLEKYSNSI